MRLPGRQRIGWWLYVGVILAALTFVAYSIVGILALGVFGYYATRPICTRLRQVVASERRAALLTVLVVLLPTVLLLLYAGTRLIQQLQTQLEGAGATTLATELGQLGVLPPTQRVQLLAFIRDPLAALDGISASIWSNLGLIVGFAQGVLGTFILLGLSLLVAYALLSRTDVLSRLVTELVGGEDTTAYSYAAAVDSDLESVFFGNFLFVLIMSAVAAVTYWVTNLVAPTGLRIPMVLVLGFLTGLASLVPIVVGKLVYVPVVAMLALQAGAADGDHLPFVGGVLLVYFVVLDMLPQSVLQPYISGRHFDRLLLLIAYILGPILFGWYGFFLLPILFVLAFELVRIVLPELLQGEPISPEPTIAADTGASLDASPDSEPPAQGAGSDAAETGADSSESGSDEPATDAS